LRERIKRFEARDAQWLTVIAQDPFYVGGMPGGQVPYPVLADPAATVSATYGVAFQVKNVGSNGWANRPATFVIDREGVIRSVADDPQTDLLQVLKDLDEERSLIGGLKAKGARLRQAAARTLAPAGGDTGVAVPALVEALQDQDSGIRTGAAAALCWIAPQARMAVPALVEALKDRDSRVRRLSATALGGIGPAARAAVPGLVRLLKDGEERVRGEAAWALAQIGPDARAAVPALLEVLADGDTGLQPRALFALGRIGPAAVPGLVDGLKDQNARIRSAAAQALVEREISQGDKKPAGGGARQSAEGQGQERSLGSRFCIAEHGATRPGSRPRADRGPEG
jgi:hypothetical protein